MSNTLFCLLLRFTCGVTFKSYDYHTLLPYTFWSHKRFLNFRSILIWLVIVQRVASHYHCVQWYPLPDYFHTTTSHSNYVTSSKWADTLICHTTRRRNHINFLYNPGHVTVWCVEVGQVTNASEGSMQEQDWARMLSFSRNSGVEFQHTVYSMFSLFAFQYIVPIEGGGVGWNVFLNA